MKSKILLLAACALSMTFVSCGNDNKSDEPESAPKIKNVECSIKVEIYNFLEIADVTITYTDETGASKSEAVTDKTWEKKLTTAKFPFNLKPTIFIKRKTDPLTKEKYELGCVTEISYVKNFTDGSHKLGAIEKTTQIGHSVYLTAKMDEFLSKYTDRDMKLGGFTLKLTADGTDVVTE